MFATKSTTEPIIPVSHAALAVGLPEHALRRLVNAGRVPSVRIAGGVRRVRVSQVLTCLEELCATAPSDSARLRPDRG